jgi:uncharacterized membrane protein
VSRSKGKRVRVWPLAVIGALSAVCLVAVLRVAQGPRFIQVAGDGLVSVEIGDLKQGSARFYSYRDRAGAELRFLLARDSNGAVHAAMDACQRWRSVRSCC